MSFLMQNGEVLYRGKVRKMEMCIRDRDKAGAQQFFFLHQLD